MVRITVITFLILAILFFVGASVYIIISDLHTVASGFLFFMGAVLLAFSIDNWLHFRELQMFVEEKNNPFYSNGFLKWKPSINKHRKYAIRLFIASLVFLALAFMSIMI